MPLVFGSMFSVCTPSGFLLAPSLLVSVNGWKRELREEAGAGSASEHRLERSAADSRDRGDSQLRHARSVRLLGESGQSAARFAVGSAGGVALVADLGEGSEDRMLAHGRKCSALDKTSG
jgi:hypothetical protein